MSIVKPDEEQLIPPPSLGGHQTPDPEYVKALMLCVNAGVWTPSDERREQEHLPPTVLEGCVSRHPENFFPPKKLLKDGGATVGRTQIEGWRHFANTALWHAQQDTFSPEGIARVTRDEMPGILNVRKGTAIRNHQHNLYFDIDAKAEGVHENTVEGLVTMVKALMRKALVKVLSDRDKVDDAIKTAELYRRIIFKIVFQDLIERIDFIRSRVESPADLEKLFAMLNHAVRVLGTSPEGKLDPDFDVEVIPLESSDAVIHGCIGLYKPEEITGGKAQVCVPMTDYGTNRRRELHEILEILAHELGHHMSRKKPLEGRPSGGTSEHDLQHSFLGEEILQRLRRGTFEWKGATFKEGGNGLLVPASTALTTRPERLTGWQRLVRWWKTQK